jgi:hypothetical protein
MQDLWWQIQETSEFTLWTTLVFSGVVFWFIREIAEDPMLALVSVPVLMAGGVLAPVLFRSQMMVLSYDKDTNVAATTAVGVIVALAVLVIGKWAAVILKEYRVGKTKIVPVVTKAGRPIRTVRTQRSMNPTRPT